MFTYVLPLLFVCAAWGLGRVVFGLTGERRPSEGMALFVGLTPVLAALSWASFVGHVGTGRALPVIVPLVLLALLAGRRYLAAPNKLELTLAGGVLLVSYLHYLWPVMAHPGTQVALLSAGDYNQYLGMGTWLQERSIRDMVDFGAGYNPLHANVADHQASHLRIGALLLLGFFSSLARSDVASAFSAYAGFMFALQALAVMLLARRIAPALPAWAHAAAGLLFGLSATGTWAIYASFLPQTLGLAFLVVSVAALVDLAQQRLATSMTWRGALRAAVPAGLLVFATWSCYPEAVPLGVLISVCYLALTLRRAAGAGAWRSALQLAAAVLAVWILAAPANFWWGLQGLLVQLHGAAHGAEQNATPWTLFGMMIGAMEQPLRDGVGQFTGAWWQLLSITLCIAGLVGIVQLVAGRDRALPLAILIAASTLFAFVVVRYGLGAHPDDDDAWALYTWNLFKAATYLAPFVSACAFLGVLAAARRWLAPAGLQLAAIVFGAGLVALAARQDLATSSRFSLVQIPAGVRALFAGVPPGRLLVDVHDSDREGDYYQRYSLYGLLGLRAFTSVRDWQPFHLYLPREPNLKLAREQYLREPFRYVLTDHPQSYHGARELARSGPYTLLDVGTQDLAVRLHEWSRPPQLLLSLAPHPSARAVEARLYNVGTAKLVYDSLGVTQEAQGTGANPFVLKLPVAKAGGLVQLAFEPQPAVMPQLTVGPADLASVPEMKVDLLPGITDAAVSTDAEGKRMTVSRENGVVRLTMPRAGTSRALVVAELEPGEYLLRMQVGQVTIKERGKTGFGAYFGPENVASDSMEIQPNSTQYLRVVTARPQQGLIAIGFGGWGRASGSIEIRKLELIRRRDARP